MNIDKMHLCVVRLSAMGDVAMTVPVINHLITHYPDLKITVVSKPHLKAVFDLIPQVDFVAAEVNDKHKGIAGIFSLYKTLKKNGVTHYLDLHNVLRTKILCLFFFLSGTKTFQLDKGRKEKKQLIKTKKRSPLPSTHERYAQVFRKIGFNLSLSKSDCITHNLSQSNEIDLFLSPLKKDKLVGIAPFAQYQSKTYPEREMLNLLKNLSKKKDCTFLLFGGGNKEVKKLDAWTKSYDNVLSVAGKFSLKDELILISKLKTMVSMDSGNGHFSAMFGVPTLTLWGTTHPAAGFKPFAQPDTNSFIPDLDKYPLIPLSIFGNKMIDGYEDVMTTIPPQSVEIRLDEILGKP